MHTQPYLPAPEALPNVDATLAGYLPNSTLYEGNPKGCACMILEAPTNPPPL